MDFGFGSLVDKFEERIGRRATSALLWLAAVALFVTCARAIIIGGLVPAIEFVRGVSSDSVIGVISSLLFGAGIALVTGLVLGGVLRLIARRMIVRAQEHVVRAEEAVEAAKSRSAELIERVEEIVRDAHHDTTDGLTATEEAKQILEQVRAQSEVERLLLRKMIETAANIMERSEATDEERDELREGIAELRQFLEETPEGADPI